MVVYTLAILRHYFENHGIVVKMKKIKKNIFSDEAHFDLGGYVNKENCRIWGTENPHACIEKPAHPDFGPDG